jgi:subtilisin family serine protease
MPKVVYYWLMRTRFLIISCLLLSVLALFAWPSTSVRSATQGDVQKALGKIAPWVLERTAGGEQAEFLVILNERADLRPAYALASKLDRGRFTRDALWRVAQTAQRPLLSWLESSAIEHRAFYIVNAIWVKGTRETAFAIALRPDVARIEANPTIYNLPNPALEKITDEANRLANGVARTNLETAIEPGVSYIRAPEVWAQGYTGQGIVVAGADTGVQWDHPALKAHYRGWDGAAANHDYNWHDSVHSGGGACGANSPFPCDDHSHGTHTVGTAVGDDGAGNQIGVAPGAKFIGCRNMDQGNGKPSTYIECMEFFLAPYPVSGTTAQGDPAKAPDITINSWTCPTSEGCAQETLKAAVEAQRAAGIMMVVAAGNSGSACSTVTDPPSHYDSAYTVGAISSASGLIASFSSRGPVAVDGSGRVKPDVTAPGVSVRSALRGGGYTSFSGTSMATPHVAGAVALLWSAEPALRQKIDLTENLLNTTAVPVSATECNSTGIPNNVYGYGKLDIKAAVDASRPCSYTVAPLSANAAASGGTGTINVTTQAGCAWTAVSNAGWITITSGASGSGNGSFNYSVAANSNTTQRTGTITAAGKTVTITQAAATTYGVSGRVTSSTGAGFSKVKMTFSRIAGTGAVPANVQTDSAGNWSQSGFAPGTTYRVTPTQGREKFTPQSRDFTGPSAALDFSSTSRGVIIHGAEVLDLRVGAAARPHR